MDRFDYAADLEIPTSLHTLPDRALDNVHPKGMCSAILLSAHQLFACMHCL